MAVARAIANGNWSSTSTWNGGVLPGNGDTVTANGFTIALDVNVLIGGANNPSVNVSSGLVTGQWYRITSVGTTSFTSIGASANTVGVVFQATGAGSGTGVATALATLTTAAAGGSSAGGGFTFASSGTLNTINADIRAGTTTCLTISGTSNVTLGGGNFFGSSTTLNTQGVNNSSTSGTISISSSTINGGNGAGVSALLNSSTGALSIASSVIVAGLNSTSYGVANSGSGTVSITGSSLTGALGSAVANLAGGSISINGSTATASGNGPMILNAASGTLNFNSGTANAGSGTGVALSNSAAGTFTITSSTLTASSTASAFSGSSTSANVSISGILIGSANGYPAVYCAKWQVGTSPTGSYVSQSLNGSSTMFTWYGADYSGFGQPATADVRLGTSYAAGSLTGTCAVPAAGSVALGVPVDNTTGTAVLTQADVQSALASYGASTLTPSQVQGAVIPLL